MSNNFTTIRALISSFSGQGRIVTIPRIYIELTGSYPTAALLNQIVFWSDKSKRKDGFFYKTYKEWDEELALSEYQVRSAVKKLKDAGVVETKLKKANGAPTLHYKLDMNRLEQWILEKLENGNLTNFGMDSEETCESLTEDYKHKSTTEEKDNSPVEAEPQIPYKKIIEYLNEVTGRNYNFKTESHRKKIRARWNEDYKYDDFKSVIDVKADEWLSSSDMKKYVRPSTLFGTKFDTYLNENIETKKATVKKPKNQFDFDKFGQDFGAYER